ncbi:hypothetical protein ACFXB3_17105 [Streptomyces sp. NPDC059447]
MRDGGCELRHIALPRSTTKTNDGAAHRTSDGAEAAVDAIV